MRKKINFRLINPITMITIVTLFLINISLCSAQDQNINWTEEELLFLEAHPVIHLGVDPRFVPFEFIDDDGEHKGIAADYLALISEKTGLKFLVQKGLTWPEAYDLALRGELDGLPAIGITPERQEHFFFSEPYYYFKRVIVTQDSNSHISGMTDLTGLTVAVQRNSSHHSYLLDYEKINLSLYDSVEAALTAVATGEELAFIGNLATTNYLIRSNGLTNLRFVTFEAEKSQALYFAVRKDWPQMISIFNKAVKAISEKEKADINKRWIDLDTQLDFRPFIRAILMGIAFFVVIIGVSFFWIVRLRKEIEERKRIQVKLEEAHRETDKANQELQAANSELEKMSMVDGLTGISNRRYFDNFLEKLWSINARENFPIALIMIDIDHFKKFNDTYGHLAGDQCLKEIATVIDNTVKRKGDFVARFGGEEFAVLLSNSTEKKAVELAERIRKNIENTEITCGENKIPVTISIGVASLTSNHKIIPDTLISAADSALYQAKNEGRNRVVKATSLMK